MLHRNDKQAYGELFYHDAIMIVLDFPLKFDGHDAGIVVFGISYG